MEHGHVCAYPRCSTQDVHCTCSQVWSNPGGERPEGRPLVTHPIQVHTPQQPQPARQAHTQCSRLHGAMRPWADMQRHGGCSTPHAHHRIPALKWAASHHALHAADLPAPLHPKGPQACMWHLQGDCNPSPQPHRKQNSKTAVRLIWARWSLNLGNAYALPAPAKRVGARAALLLQRRARVECLRL